MRWRDSPSQPTHHSLTTKNGVFHSTSISNPSPFRSYTTILSISITKSAWVSSFLSMISFKISSALATFSFSLSRISPRSPLQPTDVPTFQVQYLILVSVNAMFIKRVENGVRAKSNTIYKYTGLLKCGECGKNLVTIGSKRKEGIVRSYVCDNFKFSLSMIAGISPSCTNCSSGATLSSVISSTFSIHILLQ